MSTPIEEMLTVEQVCEHLHITRNTVRSWINMGKLKAFQPGRQILIPLESVRSLLDSTNITGGASE